MRLITFLGWTAAMVLCAQAQARDFDGCWRVDSVDFRRANSNQHINPQCLQLIEGNRYISYCNAGADVLVHEIVGAGPTSFMYKPSKQYTRDGERAVDPNHSTVIQYLKRGTNLSLVITRPDVRIEQSLSELPRAQCSALLAHVASATPLAQTAPAKQRGQAVANAADGVRILRNDPCSAPGPDNLGASAVIAMAPPGFNFGDSALTRRTVDGLLSRVQPSTHCGGMRVALLVGNGVNANKCFDRFTLLAPRQREGFQCLGSAPHAFRSVNGKEFNQYWNTVAGPGDAAEEEKRKAEAQAAAERSRQAAEAAKERQEQATQAAADSRIPVSGNGPFSAADIKRSCGREIQVTLITGGGMQSLNRVEYLPKIKASDISPHLPASADAIPTILYINRYGVTGQVRLKMFLMKDNFGDWNCRAY
jgi:hypothetical protein